jgi:hypothetical protein
MAVAGVARLIEKIAAMQCGERTGDEMQKLGQNRELRR